MNAGQHPVEIAARSFARVQTSDDGRATHPTMRPGVCQKVALALKPKIKAGCDDGMTSDWQVVQGIVKTEREPDDQQCGPYVQFVHADHVFRIE